MLSEIETRKTEIEYMNLNVWMNPTTYVYNYYSIIFIIDTGLISVSIISIGMNGGSSHN